MRKPTISPRSISIWGALFTSMLIGGGCGKPPQTEEDMTQEPPNPDMSMTSADLATAGDLAMPDLSLPAPGIVSVAPPMGATTATVAVTIKGSNFRSGATVNFGTTTAMNPNISGDGTTINVNAPQSAGKPGLVDVSVSNPDKSTGILRNGYRYFFTNVTMGNSTGATSGFAPRKVLLADLDGDKKLDAITVNANNSGVGPDTNSVSVLIGNGDGTFKARVDYNVGTAKGYVFSAALGDINGDMITDIVAVNQQDRSFSVLLGKAGGTFNPAVNTTLPAGLTQPQGVALADFNKDGILDIAIAVTGSSAMVLYTGDKTAAPTKTSTTTLTSTRPYAIITDDFNKDMSPDVALVHEGFMTNNVTVLIGSGNGTFRAPAYYTLPLPTGGFDLVSLDYNADGNKDLAITGGTVAGQVGLLTGSAAGTFTPVMAPLAAGGRPEGIAAADLTVDGHIDLVTANFSASTLTLLKGDGTGKFTANTPSTFNAGNLTKPNSLAVGDLNADGRLDLVATDYDIRAGVTSGVIRVLLNTSQ